MHNKSLESQVVCDNTGNLELESLQPGSPNNDETVRQREKLQWNSQEARSVRSMKFMVRGKVRKMPGQHKGVSVSSSINKTALEGLLKGFQDHNRMPSDPAHGELEFNVFSNGCSLALV